MLQLHLTVGVKMMDSGNLLTGVIQSVGLLGLAKTRHGLVMKYQVKPYQINIFKPNIAKHMFLFVEFYLLFLFAFLQVMDEKTFEYSTQEDWLHDSNLAMRYDWLQAPDDTMCHCVSAVA